MAQNLVPKRQNIARDMVGQATILYDALQELLKLQAEHVQSGNFDDTDFDGQNAIQQLTGFLAGDMLSVIVPALQTWMTTPLPNSGPIPQDIFLQIRS